MSFSRREFLQQTSGAVAAGLLTRIPQRQLWSRAVAEFMPEPDEALLRELAVKAMDAARTAGATFADIRLTAGRYLQTYAQAGRTYGDQPPLLAPPVIGFPIKYGIRAIVNGSWGFAGETAFTADAVVATARTAVAVARANKTRRRQTIDLAPMPAPVTGEWTTPMERDPLSVPLEETNELLLAAVEEAYKVKEVGSCEALLHWRRPTTIFATTEGTLLTQRFSFMSPRASVTAVVNEVTGGDRVNGLRSGGYGYEGLNASRLVPEMRDATRRAVEMASGPRARFDEVESGSFDVVFSPFAVASLMQMTLSPALNAERALGYYANAEGTSFAAPPNDMLGKFQIASPLITVQADRTRPHGSATAGWDDDGVKTSEYTLIRDGVITDYHTNRETAVELAPWYKARGEPMRSNGCARRTGAAPPIVLSPNLTLEPARVATSLDDLIGDVKRGFYVMELGGGADQQVINTQAYIGLVSGIRKGKLLGRMNNFAMQFVTPRFWKSVDGIGGAATTESFELGTDDQQGSDMFQPFPCSTISAVPIRARRVTALNTGRTA